MNQERILVYGSAGSGKTYAWLSLARLNPESTFHCIDTDASIDRMLQTEFSDLQNVKVYPARSWQKLEQALNLIEREVKPGDWIVVDMLCSCWDLVQAYFTEQALGKKIDDYFLQFRKNFKGGDNLEALKGWTDWVVINKIYQDFINHLCYELPQLNIFLTAKATKIDKKDEQGIKDIFEDIGAKPEGEKRNYYRVHTVLFFAHSTSSYVMTTAKDRGRKRFFAEPVRNFGEQYLAIINSKGGGETAQ